MFFSSLLLYTSSKSKRMVRNETIYIYFLFFTFIIKFIDNELHIAIIYSIHFCVEGRVYEDSI